MVSHIFLYCYVNWFQPNPRNCEIFTIIEQQIFNPINAVLREIHTPPGDKEGMPLRHPLKI